MTEPNMISEVQYVNLQSRIMAMEKQIQQLDIDYSDSSISILLGDLKDVIHELECYINLNNNGSNQVTPSGSIMFKVINNTKKCDPADFLMDADFLMTVIESLDHPFLVIDANDYSIKLANAAARAAGPANSATCYELTHHRDTPCDGKHDPCPLIKVKQTGMPDKVEHIHFCENGNKQNVEVHSHPVFDENKQVAYVIEYSLDVTERKQAEEMVLSTRDVMVFTLAKLTESRDPETGEHLERMREYSMLLSQQLAKSGPYSQVINKQFLEDMYRSAPLHDIGKVGIPDAVLLKPGRLNNREFQFMQQHAVIGADALDCACNEAASGGFLKMAAEIARTHHERYDGSGYPAGLVGQDIPLSGRIVALADVYDALTSVRVYKTAFDVEVAKSMILEESGKHFDPVIIEAFCDCWDEFLKVRSGLGN